MLRKWRKIYNFEFAIFNVLFHHKSFAMNCHVYNGS